MPGKPPKSMSARTPPRWWRRPSGAGRASNSMSGTQEDRAMEDLGINLDFSRRARIGFDEAVLCAWKSTAQIDAILKEALQNKFPILLTRLDADKYELLAPSYRELIDYDAISGTGFFNARLNAADEIE